MEMEVMKLLTSNYNLAFLILFTWLLFYVLKENAKREERYQTIISELTSRFEVLERIDADVKDVKSALYNR